MFDNLSNTVFFSIYIKKQFDILSNIVFHFLYKLILLFEEKYYLQVLISLITFQDIFCK